MSDLVGRHHSGRWVRGQSGNPGGRAGGGIAKELTLLAQSHAPEAIQVLSDIAQDPCAPHSARIYAANSLLDRGLGKVRELSSFELGESVILELDAIDVGL